MVDFKKYIKILTVLFIFPSFVLAENLKMESSVDTDTVPLNGAVELTISITADSKSVPDYTVPQLNDFNVFSTSQSKSISIINGNVKYRFNNETTGIEGNLNQNANMMIATLLGEKIADKEKDNDTNE